MTTHSPFYLLIVNIWKKMPVVALQTLTIESDLHIICEIIYLFYNVNVNDETLFLH